jgi:type IV secretion system protein VirD4
MTAAVALDAYNDPGVIACSRRDDLSPAWLLDGGAHTVYLCAPQDEQRRLRPLFVTLLSSLLTEVYARATRTGRPVDPALLLVLDEVANIAPLRDLDTVASTAAGQGIQLVTVVQDLAQVRALGRSCVDNRQQPSRQADRRGHLRYRHLGLRLTAPG